MNIHFGRDNLYIKLCGRIDFNGKKILYLYHATVTKSTQSILKTQILKSEKVTHIVLRTKFLQFFLEVHCRHSFSPIFSPCDSTNSQNFSVAGTQIYRARLRYRQGMFILLVLQSGFPRLTFSSSSVVPQEYLSSALLHLLGAWPPEVDSECPYFLITFFSPFFQSISQSL